MPQVPQGVVQLIAAPPFGILSRETLGPLGPGLSTIHRTRGPIGVDAFGISFSFFTIPAAFGSSIGVVTEYEERIVQWSAVYTDLGGHSFISTPVDVFHEGEYYFFQQALPSSILVDVQVGCTVIVYFLVAF